MANSCHEPIAQSELKDGASTVNTPGYNCSHALIIGINKYSNVSPLGYAVNDAKEVSTFLQEQFDFPRDNVILLLDGDATRSAIHKAFLSFSGDATQEDDRLLVFFAGHGHTQRSRRGDVGYLVPSDGDPSELSTLIRWDTLTSDADMIAAKHVLFIMDACYGGLAVTRALPPGASRFLKDMLSRVARQVLTAGKANEVVADLGGPRPDHSVFTGHFLDAIDGAAESQGIITANGVMAYVYQQVSCDPNSEQTPHYGYLMGDGDFIFNPPPNDSISSDETIVEDTLIPVPGVEASGSQEVSPAELAKDFLANDVDRIKLHELVVRETRSVLSAISTDSYNVQGKWSPEEFESRLESYNKAIEALEAVQLLLAFWGTESHREILILPCKRIGEQITIESGLRVWLALRWYPVLVLMYACGLGAVATQKYSNLLVLLHSPLPDRNQRFGGTKTLVQSLYEDINELESGLKTLSGHERHYVPISEYLFKKLQPLADDMLFLGADYEHVFDRVEMLIALECVHLDGWGPIGRFGWKQSGRFKSTGPLDALIAEATAQGTQWGPIKAGFFSGSFDEFAKIAEEFKKRIDKIGWF